MSYILEALKKAQAERQLGNAPTIHAPAPSYAPPASGGNRKALLIGLGAGALAVAAAAPFVLRQPAVVPAVQVAASAAPVPAAAIAVPAPDVAPPRQAAARVEPPRQSKPEPEPEPRRRATAVAAVPEPAPAARPAAALPVDPPGADDSVGPAQSLPEAVQRELPTVAFGGYIYSPNPAERLLLVDKTLRREGEEVAPGLVLERLLPKAAILNFRGYRYRVAY
ncbi:general secretion pathway protein GspB [Massilia sp. H6]|uniref:general secretion pathway protein GspB n=1 Tax=Massilia sp. H6 TaxID=2970464 RepID=UPI00216A535D|nr:general secretion pathway protein GspB [Massilia sp. H6]UVW29829.1 general secretion pathway protein GspB [Massilia sp. H6]